MGRGHLALASALAVAAAAVAVPTAARARAGGVLWTVIVSGSRLGSAEADVARLLRARAAVGAFSTQVRPGKARRVEAVDLTRSALVAVVAPFRAIPVRA